MSSSSYTASGGSRLAGRDGTIYWTEADPAASGLHQIVAAGPRGKAPVVRGIPLPPTRMRAFVATASELVWHDGAMLRVASIATGDVRHVADPGLAWLTCLTATREAAYVARSADDGSVIGRLVADKVEQLARVSGTVDQLFVAGKNLVWTLHGATDVYVRLDGEVPTLLYSGNEPFALCGAGDDHMLLAQGTALYRLALATGEMVELATGLAVGWPHALAWNAGVAYIARHETVANGVRYGSCLERVDLADDASTIVHAPVSERAIDHLIANDHGAFCLERMRAGSEHGVAIVHVTPGPVERTVIEQRGTRTAGGIRVDSAYGRLRAGFVGEVSSCAELVKRIATEQPRRLEILCAPASPGETFSSAVHDLTSVVTLVAPNAPDGSIGQLADLFTAMPSLERAYVGGDLALEPFEHTALVELHFEGDTLRPAFATSLQRSQIPSLARCALAFKRVSTASLLKLVEALAMVGAPNLRSVHFGGLRGPDQIRDVTNHLAERRTPVAWDTVSFNGALGGEDQWLDVCESIKPPGALKVALPLADMLREETQKSQLRRHRWLVDVAQLGWSPCDARATSSWP